MSDTFMMVLSLLSGVALFLYGMSAMGDGLKQVAGNKLELILYKLTNSPLKGFLLGTAVTAVIQSSSATTVMVVGFVNSGMMKVSQAIGVILGANIGTSITGWVVSLSYLDSGGGIASFLSSATITAVVAIIGILFKTFAKKDTFIHLGTIMLGFAVLMTGMSAMSGAVSPLRSNPTFVNVMTSLNNPFLGIGFGILFAAILQSVSASTGVLQALSTTGAITFGAAYPMILGMGIGASTPVLLAAMGANRNGKRTSFLYLISAFLGMILGAILYYPVDMVMHLGWDSMVVNPFSIAFINTVYRAVTMTMLLPFYKWIEKMIFKAYPITDEEKESTADFDLLEERFLTNPEVAYEQSMIVMDGMAQNAKKNVDRALELLEHYSDEGYRRVSDLEQTLNKYEDKLGNYLVKLMSAGVSLEQGKIINKSLQAISDFEKISDYALNIADVARSMHSKKHKFSLAATDEVTVLATATDEITRITVDGFINNDSKEVKRVFPLKELVSINSNEIKKRHVLRIKSGECEMEKGYELNDLLNDMTRIADHCASLALDIIKEQEQDFNTHRFLRKYQEENNTEYSELLHEYEEKYSIDGFDPRKEEEENPDSSGQLASQSA